MRRATQAKVLALVGMLAATALVTARSSANSNALCSPERASVTHTAGGHVVKQRPVRIPCANDTGFYTGETGIGVTQDGTVWFSAADWEYALVRSTNHGRSWQRVVPEGPQAEPGCYAVTSPQTCMAGESAKNGTVADAYLYIDPKTSKVFWSKTYGFAICSSLSMTPDNGKTWESTSSFGCPGGDYEKISSGPAPAGGAKPVGYPTVLYGCTNAPAPWFVVGPGRACYKSLDGGASWTLGGMPLPSPLATGCLHFQEAQTVGPDGTLFLPISCGNSPSALVRIGVSHDEGQTWSYPAVPTGSVGNGAGLIGGVSVAVDSSGVVYVVWRGTDQRPYLAVTKDQGKTWTGPMMVGMPGVTTGSVTPQVAARQPGHIAIGYYGHPTGKDGTRLSGYLTESFNAASSTPLFHSAVLNSPHKPLYFPVASGTLPRNDYLGVAIGPDGTPWVGLIRLLSTQPDAEGYVQSTGYVGWLADR